MKHKNIYYSLENLCSLVLFCSRIVVLTFFCQFLEKILAQINKYEWSYWQQQVALMGIRRYQSEPSINCGIFENSRKDVLHWNNDDFATPETQTIVISSEFLLHMTATIILRYEKISFYHMKGQPKLLCSAFLS